jgi:hypothetical protein
MTVIGVSSDGQPLVNLKGEIVLGDAKRFLALTSRLANPVVLLESPGGSVGEALQIGRIIRARGFQTVVRKGKICASMCGVLWLSGTRRLLEPGARVGFHSAFDQQSHEVSGRANAIIGSYLTLLGLSFDAIGYVATATPRQMQWMDAAKARSLGIKTSDIAAAALTPVSAYREAETAPVFTAKVGPQAFVACDKATMTQLIHKAGNGGESIRTYIEENKASLQASCKPIRDITVRIVELDREKPMACVTLSASGNCLWTSLFVLTVEGVVPSAPPSTAARPTEEMLAGLRRPTSGLVVGRRLDWSRREEGLACTFDERPVLSQLSLAKATDCHVLLAGHAERTCAADEPEPQRGGVPRAALLFVDPKTDDAVFMWSDKSKSVRLRVVDSALQSDVVVIGPKSFMENARLVIHKANGDARLIALQRSLEPADNSSEIYFGTCSIRTPDQPSGSAAMPQAPGQPQSSQTGLLPPRLVKTTPVSGGASSTELGTGAPADAPSVGPSSPLVDGRLDWSKRGEGLTCTFDAQSWRSDLPDAQLTECQSRLVGHPERTCKPEDRTPPNFGLFRLATVYIDPRGQASFVWYGIYPPKKLRFRDSPSFSDVALGESYPPPTAMRLLVHKGNGDTRLIMLHSDPDPANSYGEVFFGRCKTRVMADGTPAKPDTPAPSPKQPPGLGWPLPVGTSP